MKTKEEFINEFIESHPVVKTSGTGTGHYKWQKIYDCIDLRHGYNSKRKAELKRQDAAEEEYAVYEHDNTIVKCPRCGASTTNKWIETTGKCEKCNKEN